MVYEPFLTVLQRRFARDHTFLFKTAPEPEEAENQTPQSNLNSGGADEPAAKKQKRTVGRVADGVDFWSRVDEWYKEKVTAWGNQYGNTQWTAYVVYRSGCLRRFTDLKRQQLYCRVYKAR